MARETTPAHPLPDTKEEYMKFTKILGVVAAAALALMAFASSASATTLEVGGVKQTGTVSLEATLKSGTSALLSDTAGFFANTCTTSTVKGSDSTTQTGTAVEGPVGTLSWGTVATPCKEGNPTVDAAGSLSVEWTSGTNGTVKSKNAKVTVPSALGTLTCTTPAAGTDLGTLTGVASGSATMDVNAVLACGIDAKWTGTYSVTSPAGLGVVS
jgi:hypothetical protein